MKFLIFFFIIFWCNISFSQVPEARVMHIAEPHDNRDGSNAQTYFQDGKFGFIFPRDTKHEATFDKIISTSHGFIVQKGKLYGIANKQANLIQSIQFDSIRTLNQHYLVQKKDKWGLISDSGEFILPIKYHQILNSNQHVSLTQNKKGDFQLIINKNKKRFRHKIEFIDMFPNVVFVKSQGKFGVITDKLVLPMEFDSIAHSMNKIDLLTQNNSNKNQIIRLNRMPIFDFVIAKNNKLGLANINGEILYPPENDEIKRENAKSYYHIKKDNLYSIYFTQSQSKTDFEFNSLYSDGVGYIMAKKNDLLGVFNLKGENIIDFEYDRILNYSSLGLRVTKNEKHGLIDSKGKILIPVKYDNLSSFYSSSFRNFVKVEVNEKVGIVNLKGELIIPIEYEWIGTEKDFFKVATNDTPSKIGLFDQTGKIIIPTEYQWIDRTATENSQVLFLKENEQSYNFLNADNQLIFNENILSFDYVPNEENLLNPFHALLMVKDKNGKSGLLNQMSGKLDVPMIYDDIIQRFEDDNKTYFSAKKDNKFGLINEKNKIIIPFEYDDINLDFVSSHLTNDLRFVAAKNKKYGLINFENEVVIPFEYKSLHRISYLNLFKAKKQNQYQIIDSNNQVLNADFFDEIAHFEQNKGYEFGESPSFQSLTFKNGKMRIIDEKGQFLSEEVNMEPHEGFKSFDELKQALIQALNSDDHELLQDFSEKISPSNHILHYLEHNVFNHQSLAYIDFSYVPNMYFQDLLSFKYTYWNSGSGLNYNREALTEISDFTLYRDGIVTNTRNDEHAFGNIKYLEKILRNAIKINGYWISTYFMK